MRGEEYNPEHDFNKYGSPDQNQYDYSHGEEGSQEEDQVSKKLVGSRQARKRAEEDVKLLSNRIALLKMEEQKVFHFQFDIDLLTVKIIGLEKDRRY